MRYSIGRRDRKCLSNKYSQKLLAKAKKYTTDVIKTASKRTIQKTTEPTSDLIGNIIAEKITSVSTELHSKKTQNNKSADSDNIKDVPKKRYISPEERQQIIDELRLV